MTSVPARSHTPVGATAGAKSSRRRWRPPLRAVAALALACWLTGLALSAAGAAAAAPVVIAVSPNNGAAAGGSSISISGSGFAAGSTVAFGSAPAQAVKIQSSSSITATSPAGAGTVDVRVNDSGGTSAAVPTDQFAYDAAPDAVWLGLNGNNSTYLGPIDTFVEEGVAYDRGGPIEFTAGQLPEPGLGLQDDIADGMIPVVAIEYKGYNGNYRPDRTFPSEEDGRHKLKRYVAGFVQSAAAILAAYPGRTILFEPINEPWGYTTPQYDAAAYAGVIAALLPAAREAKIPLTSIYVAATGKHWVSEMYAAQPQLQREIAGWYLHPYGPPSGTADEDSRGIQSLPAVQAEMTSGQNNIIVSEVGYCADEVNRDASCEGQETSAQAAANLTQMLDNALPYHKAGWLRALLIYSRNAGGWAMQLPGGAFTAQGEALSAFAKSVQPAGAPALSAEGAGLGASWLLRALDANPIRTTPHGP